MSRIQNILNKAERDGTVRRMRSVADPVGGGGGVATVDSPPAAAPPPPTAVMAAVPAPSPVAAAPMVPLFSAAPIGRDQTGAPPETAVAQPAVARSVGAVHLAPTLVAALAPDAVAAEQYRSLR